jgi:acetylornithine/succinyldiaminopimelate/putrescine aminotransferase
MTTATNVMALETDHVLQVYRRGSVARARARCRLFDAEGRSYLDLVSGGVAALGHVHPRRPRRSPTGADAAPHVQPDHPLQGEAASRLAELSGAARLLCNSGTEAVEARLSSRDGSGTHTGSRRTGFVAFEHSPVER